MRAPRAPHHVHPIMCASRAPPCSSPGLIFYREYENLETWRVLMISLGCVVCIVGIGVSIISCESKVSLLLSRANPNPDPNPDPDPDPNPYTNPKTARPARSVHGSAFSSLERTKLTWILSLATNLLLNACDAEIMATNCKGLSG